MTTVAACAWRPYAAAGVIAPSRSRNAGHAGATGHLWREVNGVPAKAEGQADLFGGAGARHHGEALQEALADSTLFGPNAKPPSPYAWN